MNPVAKRSSTLILATVASLSLTPISGCSYFYQVELRGVIRSAEDGIPIAGVEVSLSPDGTYGAGGRSAFPVSSGQDGAFGISFTMSDTEFMGEKHWSVLLRKEGFQDEAIDLGAFKEPKSSEPMRIVIAVTMRPKQ